MTTPQEPAASPEPTQAGWPDGTQQPGPDAPPPGWGSPPGWQQQPGAGAPAGWSSGPPGSTGPAASDDTTWALLAHLAFFVLGVIGPLIIFLMKKDQSPFVRQHAVEALNFQITVTIAMIVSAILIIVLIGLLMLVAVFIGGAVLSVMAAIAASKGQPYRYPVTLRLVS